METGSGTAAQNGIFSRLLGFVAEMGRRRVWRTALAYGAVVFVLLQIGEIVFPAFGAPDWSLRVLVLGCFLGFPVVLCLAWVFDITAHGIQITTDTQASRSRLSNTSLPRLSLLAVTLSIVGGLGWWTVQDTIRTESVGPGLEGSAEVVPAAAEEVRAPVRSLAVLPLDDFSEEEGGEYFTAGLHEELTSQIGQISGARVLSRTSVVQFDRSGKAMPAIARELGVDGVVEGSVFRSGNRVRITVQLIHGPSDTHLWANSYEGTTDDPIAFQREIAETIAGDIQGVLFGPAETNPEETRVATAPETAEKYLRARTEQAKGTTEGLDSAIVLFQSAVEDDSAFSAARSGLAGARIRLDIQSTHQAPEKRVAGARKLAASAHYQEAENALREVILSVPENIEAWVALEDLATVQGDLDKVVDIRRQRLTQLSAGEEGWAAFRTLEGSLAQGERGFWSWKLSELEEQASAGQEVSPVDMARALVGVGRSEDALPCLETAVAQGDRKLLTLWTDPGWSTVWENPRFQEVLRRVRESGRDLLLPIPQWPQ